MCCDARRALVLVAVLSLVGGAFLGACAKRGGDEKVHIDVTESAVPAEVLAQVSGDSLEVTVMLNEGSYAIGENMIMTVVAANTTDRVLKLTFPTAQRYDFVVRQEKRIIWQWSDGKMFAQALSRHSVGPGDSIAYEFTWDQTTSDGTKPKLGTYTLQGILKTLPEHASAEHTFYVAD